ncbi:hypothetical protein KTI17_002827 [Clostridium perfringens]|uniref:hypothetical protein n=1 Tax=Clostridium perfringens TaxID=1502 RepID=UPI0039EB20EA|nr:hypothetical protein [Clostridium perfringens]EHR1332447.1 hypothetical protein [Clostridium perfringens]EHR1426027.1 hypothetical protein [Clostridium perfringens]
MKKILVLLSVTLLLAVTVMGCGKFEPKLAEYNTMYRDTLDKEANGSYPTIIIKSIKEDNGNIVVDTASPIEQMIYAMDNFITFKAYNEKGDYTDKISVKLKEVDEQGVFYLTVEDMKLEDIKYIEVGPYKTDDNDTNHLMFKLK